MASRKNMTLTQRIQRAAEIRAGRALVATESKAAYKKSKYTVFNKFVTVLMLIFTIISFLPVTNQKLNQTEIVTEQHYETVTTRSRTGSRTDNLIFISTNKGNNYEFDGKTMGHYGFTVNDTIESVKNLLHKTTGVNLLKSNIYFPLGRSNGFLDLLRALSFVLLIYWLLNNYKYATFYGTITFTTIALLLYYMIFY
jgi:hypothetical protein